MNAKFKHTGEDIVSLILDARDITDEFDRDIMLSQCEREQNLLEGIDVNELKAIIENPNLVVVGDYDADGLCSSAIARLYLNPSIIFLPDRGDGYGLNNVAMQLIGENKSILTVDCGIKSAALIREWTEKGCEFVVTDHHYPDMNNLPESLVINPHLNNLEFDNYSGSGVIYKVLRDLYGDNEEALQLAAIGTVADVMPMRHENRRIVREGIRLMRSDPIPAIRALADVSYKRINEIDEKAIGWYFAPMINAASRVGQLEVARDLLLSNSYDEAMLHAKELRKLNNRRKREVQKAMSKCNPIARDNDISIFEATPDTRGGYIGLIANKIAQKLGTPTVVILISEDESVYLASARGVPGFNCSSLVHHCRSLLISGGGHWGAAGFAFTKENKEEVVSCLREYARSSRETGAPAERFDADIEIDLFDAISSIEEVESLKPYGQGFKEPLFLSIVNGIDEFGYMGKENQHVQFEHMGVRLIGFGIGDKITDKDNKLEIVYELGRDSFRGNSPLAVIREVRVL